MRACEDVAKSGENAFLDVAVLVRLMSSFH